MKNSTMFFDVAYQELAFFPEADPRTDEWLLMDSPGVVLAICGLYYLVVWKGPQWMEHRKPFEFPRLLFWYNVLLVCLSFFISYEFFGVAYQDNYALFGCQPVVTGNSPLAMRMTKIAWWYFFSKIIEFMDSVIFILRKKNNQLSFLHVYHHGTMPFFCWISARYVPGGAKFVAGGLNSAIHVMMYSYYALAAMGPEIQKYLWWKKHITKLQIIQFSIVILHSLRGLFLRPCAFPKLVNLFVVCYTGTFLSLFANFYHTEYLKKRRQLKEHRQ
ncbi:very long chain fatty acid elongase 4-like [Haliotis cracherodii]|uniref:very long chain fatty acid elongase 4-like n=1 Tax=Haliotis cracherodii TaxID=6455 RepID=UPI0039ED3B10